MLQVFGAYVGVNFCCLAAFVPKYFLYISQVGSCL
jgi:hypothetical protein